MQAVFNPLREEAALPASLVGAAAPAHGYERRAAFGCLTSRFAVRCRSIGIGHEFFQIAPLG
jgi:hypothetical protein